MLRILESPPLSPKSPRMVPGVGGSGVGGSEEVADFVDDVFASESEGDDGGFLHEGADLGEEGFVGDVGVVFGE